MIGRLPMEEETIEAVGGEREEEGIGDGGEEDGMGLGKFCGGLIGKRPATARNDAGGSLV
jgi:hypothetical protein